MPYKSTIERKAYYENYNKTHRKERSEYTRKWKQRHPEKIRKYSRDDRAKYPERWLLQAAKARAKKTDMLFELDKNWLMAKLAKGICEVTKLPLDFKSFGQIGLARPFAPSLDRKNSELGYTKENTQLVAWIYNACKSHWTHEDVMKMAIALTLQA